MKLLEKHTIKSKYFKLNPEKYNPNICSRNGPILLLMIFGRISFWIDFICEVLFFCFPFREPNAQRLR